jgi:hypothetical protein
MSRILVVTFVLAITASAEPQAMPSDPGDGWTLSRTADGRFWWERPRRRRRMAWWLTGLIALADIYATTGIMSALDSESRLGRAAGIGFLPVFGAFAAAGIAADHHCDTTTRFALCPGNDFAVASYAVLGVLQAFGFAMMVGGLSSQKMAIERQPIPVVPAVIGQSGVGLTAGGRF